MDTRILGLPISALILAYGTLGAMAQDRTTAQHPQQQIQSHPMGHEEQAATGQGDTPAGHGAMEGHMMGRAMMGGDGMVAPFMMRMMFALMDADGDGTVSLQEFQTAHERIFKAMDSNKDGKLTPEEIQSFVHGTK